MNRETLLFPPLVGGSLVVHLAVIFVLYHLPAGGVQKKVEIYTVKIIEVPAQPKISRLEPSARALSDLNLRSPSLTLNSPALGPDENLPWDEPSPSRLPILPPLALQPDLQTEGIPQTAESILPDLPKSAPAKIPDHQVKTPSRTAPEPGSNESTLPPLAERNAPGGHSPLEQLRQKVQSLNLNFEEPPSGLSGRFEVLAENSRSKLSLRIFRNLMQERIKESYTFPGRFDKNLRGRLRYTISQNGAVSHVEIIESSGNIQFDELMKRTIRNAKFPPLPESLVGETLTQVISFSP